MVGAHAPEDLGDLSFDEAASFFDDDESSAALGELGDDLLVDGVGHAEFEDGDSAREAELGEGVREVGVCDAGGDEAELDVFAALWAVEDAVDAVDSCGFFDGGESLGEEQLASPGAWWE